MKNFLLSLCILTLWSTLAFALGPVDLRPLNTVQEDVCAHQMTGTATYALASALTGTTSSVIDLGLFGCFAFSVTSTAGAVQVWGGNTNNTYTAGTLYGTALPGSYSLPKFTRYVWFKFPQSFPSVWAPLEVTPSAATASVWYYTPTNWPN